MPDWVLITGLIIGLFLAATLVKTIVGLVVRYAIFVALAGLIYRMQAGEEVNFVDPQLAATLATVGALAFVATLGIITLFFRNSRFKVLLFPIIGFATTFAAAAIVAYGS